MLMQFELNRMDQTTRNLELFDKIPGFFENHIRQSVDTILEDVSVAETIVSCYYLSIS